MTKAILLSIHPEWAQRIFSGLKILEWRKSVPKFDGTIKVYMYETSPIQKITGYFEIVEEECFVQIEDPLHCDSTNIVFGQVTREDLANYKGNSKYLYGWRIHAPQKFKNPKTLADFGLKRPPQSWQYVEVNNG